LRNDWPNEKQVASVELLRWKLHLEFFALRSHDGEKTACSHRGSHEVEQRCFTAVTSKKSA